MSNDDNDNDNEDILNELLLKNVEEENEEEFFNFNNVINGGFIKSIIQKDSNQDQELKKKIRTSKRIFRKNNK